MKKLTNNQKALFGIILIICSWSMGILFKGALSTSFLFFFGIALMVIGFYFIWPIAKEIDKFNDIHKKKF